MVESVDAPILANQNEVETGSRVNSFYLNVQTITTAETALNNLYFIIYKNPGGNIDPAALPNANNVGTSDFKTKVFHQEMRMMANANDGIPINMFTGVIRIPRFMRRMGINDKIELQFFGPGAGNTHDACVQCIYKEFR